MTRDNLLLHRNAILRELSELALDEHEEREHLKRDLEKIVQQLEHYDKNKTD